MSGTPSTAAASTSFRTVLISALKLYEKRTKKDLITHPLASQLQSCDTPAAILAILKEQACEFDQARVGDDRLTKWLDPTVSVLYAFCAALGGGVGLAFSPASVIFAGIGVFLMAAKDVSASRDVVMDLFERIEFFFRRLEAYTEITPTAAMTDIITKILVEVLTIFGIATKEIKQGRGKRFLKRLAGRTDIENALKRLDRLTREEAQMAVAENLKVTHSIRDIVINDGKEAKVTALESKLVIQQIASTIDQVKWNQLKQLLRGWLSPSDPSVNHNTALGTQHRISSVWFLRGRLHIEWKFTGSLLWIHGKPGSGKSIICSSIIEDIMTIYEAGLAIVAYFYFDFRDEKKQTCHDLLLSLVIQLSTRSYSCNDILNRIYTTHEDGGRQPSDAILEECLKEMLKLPGLGPVFVILDALDESPNVSWIPTPRNQVLRLVKGLVDLRLQNLHICVTSRPETDIQSVLEPLAFRSVSLQDESGQKADIAEYIRSVVYSDTDMKRWRAEEKELVIVTLTERADGMFRWVYCQLETLHQCLPQNVRRFLDELPESLDKTYEQILKGIPKPKVEQARRLLRCLAVSVRPLRVEELAELLAFDFPDEAHEGKIPILDVNWRLENKEEAILSICSSLITVVQNADSRVVQFSHFSVKEYLTSPRLALSNCDFSQFHIRLEPAHTILAQACLGTLLRLDQGGGNGVAEEFPLADYAARHWAAHAQLAAVSSGIQKGMDDLFDLSKPYFTAWLRTHDIDKDRDDFTSWSPPSTRRKSPLYYAALCGLYDLAKRLIVKYPGDIQPAGDRMFAPLPAALRRKHFRVADLLYQHGAAVDIRDFLKNTTLHTASMYGLTDIVQWLLDHGADVNSQAGDCWTPLHLAANNNHPEVVQVLLDNNADVHASTGFKETPLSFAIDANHLGVVKILLERGADPNARGSERLCPLHVALTWRSPEVARLLLEHGANAHEKDKRGMSPFEVASVEGLDEITELLSEYGAKPEP